MHSIHDFLLGVSKGSSCMLFISYNSGSVAYRGTRCMDIQLINISLYYLSYIDWGTIYQQDFSCAGVMYLCQFIEQNGGKLPERLVWSFPLYVTQILRHKVRNKMTCHFRKNTDREDILIHRVNNKKI